MCDRVRPRPGLLSRNRMNVAVSRVQVAAYIVCSPGLHQAPVRTVEQIESRLGLWFVAWTDPGQVTTAEDGALCLLSSGSS